MSVLILTSNRHPVIMDEYEALKNTLPQIVLQSFMPPGQLMRALLINARILILNVKYLFLFMGLFIHLDKFPPHHLLYWYLHLVYVLVLDRKYSFRVIHAQWLYPAGLIATTYSKFIPKHVVITVHGYDADERTFSNERLTKLVIEVGLRANKLITAERRLYDNLLGHGLNGVVLTNNFVDTSKYDFNKETSEIRSQLQLEKDAFVVVFGPRVSEMYGALDFARAIVKISKDIPNLFVICLGEVQTNYVAQLFAENRVQHRLTGELDNEMVFSYLKACDIVCNFGYISQGVFTLEAFACGKATIGFYDIREVKIEDGITGLLAKSGDVEGIAKLISELYVDEKLRKVLEKNAKEILKSRYSKEKRINDILAAYR